MILQHFRDWRTFQELQGVAKEKLILHVFEATGILTVHPIEVKQRFVRRASIAQAPQFIQAPAAESCWTMQCKRGKLPRHHQRDGTWHCADHWPVTVQGNVLKGRRRQRATKDMPMISKASSSTSTTAALGISWCGWDITQEVRPKMGKTEEKWEKTNVKSKLGMTC